jgi:hypothetical protein
MDTATVDNSFYGIIASKGSLADDDNFQDYNPKPIFDFLKSDNFFIEDIIELLNECINRKKSSMIDLKRNFMSAIGNDETTQKERQSQCLVLLKKLNEQYTTFSNNKKLNNNILDNIDFKEDFNEKIYERMFNGSIDNIRYMKEHIEEYKIKGKKAFNKDKYKSSHFWMSDVTFTAKRIIGYLQYINSKYQSSSQGGKRRTKRRTRRRNKKTTKRKANKKTKMKRKKTHKRKTNKRRRR